MSPSPRPSTREPRWYSPAGRPTRPPWPHSPFAVACRPGRPGTPPSLLTSRVQTLLGLQQGEYEIQIRCYGANAVLGPLEPETVAPREVGVLFQARAADQATATAIAKITNPFLLHLPLPGSEHM